MTEKRTLLRSTSNITPSWLGWLINRVHIWLNCSTWHKIEDITHIILWRSCFLLKMRKFNFINIEQVNETWMHRIISTKGSRNMLSDVWYAHSLIFHTIFHLSLSLDWENGSRIRGLKHEQGKHSIMKLYPDSFVQFWTKNIVRDWFSFSFECMYHKDRRLISL